MCGIVGFGDHRRCPPGHAAVSVLGPAPAVPDAVVTRAGETTVVAAPIPLDDLPGIDRARIWEPEPERMYAWAR